MLKTRIITKKLKLILLASWLLMSNLSSVLALSSSPDSQRYEEMTFVKGTNPDLMLYINKKSLNIDLLKTDNIRVRIKTSGIYNAIDKISSFKISMYEIINGERQFISSQTLTVFKGTKKSRIVSIAAGYFAAPVKQVEFDVFDTAGNLINTYATELTATNLISQVSGGDGVNLHSAECDYTNFDDCQLDYLFNRITFEAKPQKQVSTRVIKSEEGLYKVTIPVPRSQFTFLGRNVNRAKKDGMNTDNGNGGLATSAFGESLNISTIYIGNSSEDQGVINYNNNHIYFNNALCIGPDGKLGVGYCEPEAWLHVKGGDGVSPSVIINPGTLTSTPHDGALEYDGSNVYFTKNGVRSPLGERGLTGPTGPVGPQGAQGPQGPAGSGGLGSLNTNTVVNGDLIFVNGALLENATLNGNVFADTINASLFNGTTFNGVTANFSTGNFTTLNATSFTGTSFSGSGAGLIGVQAVNASLLANLSPNQFLRSDVADTYRGTELDFSATSKLDLNGDLEIADTNILFDGTSTTFTQSSGAMTLYPANGSNMNVLLEGVSDFIVDTNKLVVDNNGNVGISYINPSAKLAVNGTILASALSLNGTSFSLLSLTQGDILFAKENGIVKNLAKGTNHYALKVNGNKLAWEADTIGSGTVTSVGLTATNGLMILSGSPITGAGTIAATIDKATFLQPSNNLSDLSSAATARTNLGLGSLATQSGSFSGTSSGTNTGDQTITLTGDVTGSGTGSFAATIASADSTSWAGKVSDETGSGAWVFGTSPTLTTATLNTPTLSKVITLNGNAMSIPSLSQGSLLFSKSSGNIKELAKGTNHYALKVNGNKLAWEADNTGVGGGGDATTLDSLDSLQFLRADTSTTYSSGTFTMDAATGLDINSTSVSIADTDITLDGASTTFTQSTGAITMAPANGSNMNIRLDGVSDFIVDTNKFVVNNNGNVGIGYINPQAKLAVNGQVLATVFNGSFIGNGKQLTGIISSTGNATTLDNLDSTDFLRSNEDDSFTGTKTLTIAAAATLDVDGTSRFDGITFDVNSTAVSIADTNISLDGASTKFTQTTGAIQMIPSPGTTFTVNGALTMVPSDVVLISAASSIPVNNSIVKIVGDPGAVNITFDPQIADGVHGQIIIIRGTDNTKTVTLEEGAGLSLTDGLSFILGNKDTMSLMYDASDDQWIEISRSDK